MHLHLNTGGGREVPGDQQTPVRAMGWGSQNTFNNTPGVPKDTGRDRQKLLGQAEWEAGAFMQTPEGTGRHREIPENRELEDITAKHKCATAREARTQVLCWWDLLTKNGESNPNRPS